MPNIYKKPSIVFDFIRSPAQRITEVQNGKAPRESFLGYIQLLDRGWCLTLSDDRWQGIAGTIREKLRDFIEVPSFAMIRKWKTADIIVIVTRLSIVLATIARILNKKIVEICLSATSNVPAAFSTRCRKLAAFPSRSFRFSLGSPSALPPRCGCEIPR